jgi:hypothetical protein
MASSPRLTMDPNGVRVLIESPEIKQVLKRLGDDILRDAQQNLEDMDAVKSGVLKRSGRVYQEQDGTTAVVFEASYAEIVHEGEGTSRKKGPRPYLANAVAKNRGEIR